MASGDTKTNQYLDIAANGTRADLPSDTCCETRSQTLIRGVAERIMDVEDEVERLENNPDVADIVATYADLQAYDKTQLTDKDVIRVLQDETHDGDSTYYRYSTDTQAFTYIGESKQYTDFVGTDGTTAGTHGLVPAPATTDADKFLKSDGTWDDAGGGTLYSGLGQNTDGAMTQKAVTDTLFADGATATNIRIGASATTNGRTGVVIGPNSKITSGGANSVAIGNSSQGDDNNTIAIGYNAYAKSSSIAIGNQARTSSNSSNMIAIGGMNGTTPQASGGDTVALGYRAQASNYGSVALGVGSKTGRTYEVAVGNGISGNEYATRYLANVKAGALDTDAVNKKQLDTTILNGGTTAPTTSTVGAVGTLYSYVDTTGTDPEPHLMVCTAVSGSTYTWTDLLGGVAAALNQINNGGN